MNKKSKRIIYVDGTKSYDAKSNITNWRIPLETDSRSFDYSLSINERPFEELTTSTTESIATTIRVSDSVNSGSTTEDNDNSDSGTGNQNNGSSDSGALNGIVYGVIEVGFGMLCCLVCILAGALFIYS